MRPTLNVKLSLPFIVAFISLRHLFHEVHETMHMTLGRYLCDSWGTRDFNNVHPINPQCAQFVSPVVGLEGALFNYIVIWLGVLLIWTAEGTKKLSWGIVLIFANLPMARLFTALAGGGDELGVVNGMVHDPLLAKIIVCTLISAILFYPLLLVYRSMKVRSRLYLFFGFLFIPMVVEGMLTIGLFNHMLNAGIGNKIWLMGMPELVVIVLLADLIILGFFIRNIATLLYAKRS